LFAVRKTAVRYGFGSETSRGEHTVSILSLGLLLCMSVLNTPEPPATYEVAYNKAVAEKGTPLVVLVGADWCPACQAMKQSVLPQVKRDGGLTRVAFAMVNTDRDSVLAHQLMVGGSIPQLVMFVKTDDGWTRRQLTGNQSVSLVEGFIADGLNTPLMTTASR
jgi:thiol-disulfide isomerase/thioredoxin